VSRLPVAADAEERVSRAWLGRAVGCLLGKPVESIPREGISSIARGTGNWPIAGYFTAEGLDPAVTEHWPWNRASRTTSLAENIDGMPEDDDLNFTMLAVALLERAGSEFTSVDVAKIWLDFLPPGRIFTAERVACRNLLLAKLPPETATHHNPFREWIGARLRVDVYGWASPGDPERAARMAYADASLSHTANGVYAAMFMAAAHAATLADATAADAVEVGLGVVPAESRLADAIRFACSLDSDWAAVLDALYERYGALHWVHAINNTALVAAAMTRFTSFDEAIGAVVAGGWDTDTNGAAIGSIFGALDRVDPRWSDPLHDMVASSLPGFDGSTFDALAQRTLAVTADAARS
jgi:ADP-ribosylglycohydrolase